MSRILSFLEDRRLKVALEVFLLLLLAILLFQTYRRAYRSYGYDFSSYLEAASALAQGQDPYHVPGARFPYIYPLALAFALIPMTKVPYAVAVALWFVAGAGSLHLVARWASRLDGGAPWRLPLFGLVALAFLDPLQINLLNGQVNTEVLLLAVLFFDRYVAGRKTLAAVLLGLAIAIKIMPAVLLLFLFLRREIRMLAVTIAVSIVFCLLPYLAAGTSVFSFYATYAHEFLLSRAHGLVPEPHPIFFTPYGLVTFLVPALGSSLLIRYGALVAVIAALAFFDLRRRSDTDPLRFASYLAAIPLLSPMSEVHHLLLVIPAAFFVTAAALRDGSRAVQSATGAFWICLWLGRVWRQGPFYFLSLVALGAALLLADRIRTHPDAKQR